MDVTTMASLSSLINQLKKDYPHLSFTSADEFRWSSLEQTVYIASHSLDSPAFCLHEVSHAILEHENYRHDIDLLKLERDAWIFATTTLAPKYNVTITDEVIQDNLDTYRDWLHARSTCPHCSATGIQQKTRQYRCIACGQIWNVNEARLCRLKRSQIK